MYIPQHFRVDDPTVLHRFIADNSFGTLISIEDGVPIATHLPFLLHPSAGEHGHLLGHIALANPQWRSLEANSQVVAIFQGPHGYISPSWYTVTPSVPTWNYTAVHAYGKARIASHDELIEIIRASVATYEESQAQPWQFDSLSDDYIDKMARAIVGFEISITRIEGKFKLSQNRSAEDIRGVIDALEEGGDPAALALAGAMRETP